MRLGELLLSEKLVTPEGLEEALEAQVVHGGRLGTNLVELGLLQEKDLAKALGKLLNTAFASGEMNPDPKAIELIDPNFADDKDVLPMRVDATRITVAVINPHDLETLDAIAFKSGKRVVPVVIPEFRMNQLLRRYCKAFRNMRSVDMNSIRPSKTLGTIKDGRSGSQGPDLMDDAEFQKLYAKGLAGGTEPTADELPDAVIEGQEVGEEPPAPSWSRPLAALPSLPHAPVQLNARSEPTQLRAVEGALPAAPEAPVTPLTFLEAQQQLQRSNDREDIAKTVLQFASGKWKRSLLLSVQGDLLTGWHGAGRGIQDRAVGRIGVALVGQSSFKLVRDTRSHYIGPMKRDAGTAVFYKRLGGGYPKTAVMLPLLVRGKVVHILYVDNGPDVYTPPDIGELLIVAQGVARSYEALMKRRKSGQ